MPSGRQYSLYSHLSILEKVRENTVLEGVIVPQEDADGFDPLKAVLHLISAAYADHKVRSRPILETFL